LSKINKAKIIIQFVEAIEFNDQATYEEALEEILNLLENKNNYKIKLKVQSEEGFKADFDNKMKIMGKQKGQKNRLVKFI